MLKGWNWPYKKFKEDGYVQPTGNTGFDMLLL